MNAARKVVIFFGTRAEAIKIAPVVRELDSRTGLSVMTVAYCVERTLLEAEIADLDLTIDKYVACDIAQETSAVASARLIEAADRAIEAICPDLVVIQGDTNSAFATAVAAQSRRVPVVHIEAGLRMSHDGEPRPDEINRRLIAQLANLHLAPTPLCWSNLVREGVDGTNIFVVGNTTVDALRWAIACDVEIDDPALSNAVGASAGLVLVNVHRAESWGGPLDRIAAAVSQLARRWTRVPFVVVLHDNDEGPNALAPALRHLPNVVLTGPLAYLEFTHVMKHARLILTDSGGVQVEAAALNIPTLVVRESSERDEGLSSNIATLVGTDIGSIVATASKVGVVRPGPANVIACEFGDGQAARRSADAMLWFLHRGVRPSNYLAPPSPSLRGLRAA